MPANGVLAPFRGLVFFLAHPGLWLAPLAASLLALIALGAALASVAFGLWPAGGSGWWTYTRGICWAIGCALAAALATWTVIVPLLFSLAYEGVVRRVFRSQGVAICELPLARSLAATLLVLWRTLGWRLFWPLAAVACALVLPPLAPLLGSYGIAHIAVIDGCDTALALRGLDGGERLAVLRSRRPELLAVAASAALCAVVLGFTVVGIVLWMPAVFTGAALWVAGWPLAGRPAEAPRS